MELWTKTKTSLSYSTAQQQTSCRGPVKMPSLKRQLVWLYFISRLLLETLESSWTAFTAGSVIPSIPRHVSVDDLDERSSKKTSFTGTPGTDRENDAWRSVSRRSPWVTLLTAPAHRWEQSLAMQRRSQLQYIQDSSPEKEPSGLLQRYITQAHILQSRKKPTFLICFTETSSSQTC